jgi:hypothetical protein
MQTQITTHAAGHPTTVQIGATLVKFVEHEGKFVSEFVQKEIADLLRGIEGYEFKDFTDAEVKKISSGESTPKVVEAAPKVAAEEIPTSAATKKGA